MGRQLVCCWLSEPTNRTATLPPAVPKTAGCPHCQVRSAPQPARREPHEVLHQIIVLYRSTDLLHRHRRLRRRNYTLRRQQVLGTVTRLNQGKLILETAFAGTLEIDAALVVTIETDEPVNVGVDTGDRLVGPIEWKPEVNTAVVQTELGGVPVAIERNQRDLAQGRPESRSLGDGSPDCRGSGKRPRRRGQNGRRRSRREVLFKEGNSDEMTVRGRIEAPP